MRLDNYDFVRTVMRPYDAPPYVPDYAERNGHEVLYFFWDLLDQALLLPITAHATVSYVLASTIYYIVVQLHIYADLADVVIEPLVVEINRAMGFSTSCSPYPAWLKINPLAIDYHTRCRTIYDYRFYPTYELGKMVSENWSLHWHLTFDPAKIGTLGMNMAEPRYVHTPIACLGADFNIGPVKGAFHFGWKFNGNGFLVDSISKDGIKFCDPASSPRLGLWLTFEFYEYNSAPPSRSQVQNLLRIN